MAVLIVFLLLLSPPVVELLIHARRTLRPAPPLLAHGVGPSGGVRPGAGTEDVPAWSALDDHQLTRLLMSSASS